MIKNIFSLRDPAGFSSVSIITKTCCAAKHCPNLQNLHLEFQSRSQRFPADTKKIWQKWRGSAAVLWGRCLQYDSTPDLFMCFTKQQCPTNSGLCAVRRRGWFSAQTSTQAVGQWSAPLESLILLHFKRFSHRVLFCINEEPLEETLGLIYALTLTLTHSFTFHTGGSGSGRASDLPRETGTLDGLRALLNLILITAAMHRHHLTCPLLHLVWCCERERKRRRGKKGGGIICLKFIDCKGDFVGVLAFVVENNRVEIQIHLRRK